ncbi:MAG TPA: hypothetical protein VI197_24345 [Polyangiaceae bacterium]
MRSRLDHEVQQQRLANDSSLPHALLYTNHRQHLTQQLLRHSGSDQSLCILGAGNCNDVELDALLQHYRQVHLVDLDSVALDHALDHALARLPESEIEPNRERIHRHAPVDLSGMLPVLDRWQRFQLTPEELMRHPEATAQAIAQRLGAQFDVVASACLITQMQLAVLQALGESHRLFQAIRHTLSVTHLRTLAALTRPGGRVVFASDLVASDHLPLPDNASATTDAELKAVFEGAVRQGTAMHVAHPGILGAILRDDPILERDLQPEPISDVWLWHQGPARRFLVYAQHFVRGA